MKEGLVRQLTRYSTDPNGNAVAHVPILSSDGKHATILTEDLRALETEGVSLRWYLNRANGREYVNTNDPDHLGGNQVVARRILGARTREAVRYLDGDTLNLRRSNLYLDRGPSANGKAPKISREQA